MRLWHGQWHSSRRHTNKHTKAPSRTRSRHLHGNERTGKAARHRRERRATRVTVPCASQAAGKSGAAGQAVHTPMLCTHRRETSPTRPPRRVRLLRDQTWNPMHMSHTGLTIEHHKSLPPNPEQPPCPHPPRGVGVWGTLPRASRVFRRGPGEAQPDPGAVVWLLQSAPPGGCPLRVTSVRTSCLGS